MAPLIGLLGTIIGLLKTFVQIGQSSGYATADQMSVGLYESFLTSAVGIVVAIPTFTFYSYLVAVSRSLMHDMERAGIEVVNLIHDHRNRPGEIVSFRQPEASEEPVNSRT